MKGKVFNAQEVQAIIAGNKTMFREVIKAQPNSEINPVYLKECNSWQWATKESRRECPYQVGQKIFVKENFYLAWKKRPAQHMKQEHSRITLEITSIRVERLRDISEGDAIKEGLDLDSEHSRLCLNIQDQPYSNDLIDGSAFKTIFAKNWNATHKKPEEKFEANPFVWVVDFKVNK